MKLIALPAIIQVLKWCKSCALSISILSVTSVSVAKCLVNGIQSYGAQ